MALRKAMAKLALADADDTRYLFSGLLVCNTDGTPRGGVLSPVGVNLVASTATMNVSVARFQGAAVRDAGVVLLANDGPANVLLDAAPAANSRIDVIYAKQNDASSTVTVPDANNTPVLAFVKGTAGAVPVKPAIPVGALELATVTIPSTATATNSAGVVITQTAQFTASGGVVPFRTKAELDLWTTAAPNQRAFVSGDGITYRFNGAAWKGWDSDWITYTPTLTGIAVGTGGSALASARYKYSSGMVVVDFAYVLGASGFTAPSVPELTLPVTARAAKHPYVTYAGDLSMYDVSPGINYPGKIVASSSAVDKVRLYSTNAGAFANIGATVPFTWAAGDALAGQFTYEPA